MDGNVLSEYFAYVCAIFKLLDNLFAEFCCDEVTNQHPGSYSNFHIDRPYNFG